MNPDTNELIRQKNREKVDKVLDAISKRNEESWVEDEMDRATGRWLDFFQDLKDSVELMKEWEK